MSFSWRKRSTVFCLLLLVIVTVPLWLTWREWRQERLNLALVQAIKRTDTLAAVSALEAGADANALDNGTQRFSIVQRLRMLFAPRPSGVLPAPTALEVAVFVPQIPDTAFVELADQRLPIIQKLLEHHADPNTDHYALSDSTGPPSLLFYAVDIHHEPLADLLLQHGANPNVAESREGLTPLMRAAFYPNSSLLNQLLTHGANVNAEQKLGRTALMIACDAGNIESVRQLLAHHADVNHRSQYGRTALQAAQDHGNRSLVKLLLQAGAKL